MYISVTLWLTLSPFLLLTSIAILFTEQHLNNFSVRIFPKNPVLPVIKTVPFLNESTILDSIAQQCLAHTHFGLTKLRIQIDKVPLYETLTWILDSIQWLYTRGRDRFWVYDCSIVVHLLYTNSNMLQTVLVISSY